MDAEYYPFQPKAPSQSDVSAALRTSYASPRRKKSVGQMMLEARQPAEMATPVLRYPGDDMAQPQKRKGGK